MSKSRLQIQAEAELELRRRYGSGFKQFIENSNKKYQFYRHAETLVNVGERVARGDLKRVMIFMPPRHSKSETFSRELPAYYLFVNPEHHIGLTSYSAELAYTLSRDARNNYETTGRILSEDASAVKEWHNQYGGRFWSAGVGGSITGKGFHCFSGENLIHSSVGDITIGQLCNMENKPMVLTFNHKENSLEWKPIVRTARLTSSDFIKIEMRSGRKIRCTPDHRIFCIGRGYVEAKDILQGETVIQVEKAQKLYNMQRKHTKTNDMPKVLSYNQGIEADNEVCYVREGIREESLRSRKTVKKKPSGFLLFDRMFEETPFYETQKKMSMWERNKDKDIKILPRVLCEDKIKENNVSNPMWGMWDRISSTLTQNEILFDSMQEQKSFKKNDRNWKFEILRGKKLWKSFQENEESNTGKRFSKMSWMRSFRKIVLLKEKIGEWWISVKNKFSDSPFGRKSDEQPSEKSGNTLFYVPQEASQTNAKWETDTVSKITRTSGNSEYVYDLTIKDNSNFFVDGILVHNCGIIDDPVKNQEEAYSDKVQDAIWEWYRSVFYTRQEPNAAIVIVMTRWHENDLCGRLLFQEKEIPEHWHIVNMQAIKDSANLIKIPDTCTIEPDWREEGQALCPERYNEEKLYMIRRALGESSWGALYQQNPIIETGLVWKKQWFENVVFDKEPEDLMSLGYDWDSAYTKDEGNAACAYVKAGVSEADGNIYVTGLDFKWMDFPEYINWMLDLGGMHYIEAKASGKSAVQMMQKVGAYAYEVPVKGGDKIARAKIATPIVERGRVKIKREILHRLLYDDRQGLIRFPLGTHADLNDAFVQMLNRLTPFTKQVIPEPRELAWWEMAYPHLAENNKKNLRPTGIRPK